MIKINGRPINIEYFPNGESKIFPFNIDKYDGAFVTLVYESNDDLINLMFIKHYIDEHYPRVFVTLMMPYIPYERMDRQTPKQMFTSKYFGQFINSLNFPSVYVFDPHSQVSVASIKNIQEINLVDIIAKLTKNIDYLFFPDNGAKKKYAEILDSLNVPYFHGDKHRDIDTGKITDYDIINAPDLKDKSVLIVDDLCVKGFTTLFAAKKLKAIGANKVYFYCSHCESAVFDGELLTTDYVDKIYTTNSLIRSPHEKIISVMNF